MTNAAYNLMMTVLALMIWGAVTVIIQFPLKQLWLSHNTAQVVGATVGFIITFVGMSYFYYRKQLDTSDSPSFIGIWKLMFEHWRNS